LPNLRVEPLGEFVRLFWRQYVSHWHRWSFWAAE
jgi:hypothetical protein